MAIRLELPAILDNEDDRVAVTLVIALKTKIVCGAAQKNGRPNVAPAALLPEDHVLAILASSNVDNL
jgi:hypothetical protein